MRSRERIDVRFAPIPRGEGIMSTVTCRKCRAEVHPLANVCLACGHSTWGKWHGDVYDGAVYDVEGLDVVDLSMSSIRRAAIPCGGVLIFISRPYFGEYVSLGGVTNLASGEYQFSRIEVCKRLVFACALAVQVGRVTFTLCLSETVTKTVDVFEYRWTVIDWGTVTPDPQEDER
jgi:hypothetical protein